MAVGRLAHEFKDFRLDAAQHRPAMPAAREKFAKKRRKAALRQTSFTAAKQPRIVGSAADDR
jgi:hypothetical protein